MFSQMNQHQLLPVPTQSTDCAIKSTKINKHIQNQHYRQRKPLKYSTMLKVKVEELILVYFFCRRCVAIEHVMPCTRTARSEPDDKHVFLNRGNKGRCAIYSTTSNGFSESQVCRMTCY